MAIQDQSLLEAALIGLEVQKDRIEAQIGQVRALLGKRGPGRPPKSVEALTAAVAEVLPAAAPAAAKKVSRRKMSAEGRARIAEAQRRRWAALKKG